MAYRQWLEPKTETPAPTLTGWAAHAADVDAVIREIDDVIMEEEARQRYKQSLAQ